MALIGGPFPSIEVGHSALSKAGFLLIKGDADKLARLRASEEFIALNTRAQLVVDGFGVAGAFVGEGLQSLYADFGKQAAGLG